MDITTTREFVGASRCDSGIHDDHMRSGISFFVSIAAACRSNIKRSEAVVCDIVNVKYEESSA